MSEKKLPSMLIQIDGNAYRDGIEFPLNSLDCMYITSIMKMFSEDSEAKKIISKIVDLFMMDDRLYHSFENVFEEYKEKIKSKYDLFGSDAVEDSVGRECALSFFDEMFNRWINKNNKEAVTAK